MINTVIHIVLHYILRDVIATACFYILGCLESSDFMETLLTGHIPQFISNPSSTVH